MHANISFRFFFFYHPSFFVLFCFSKDLLVLSHFGINFHLEALNFCKIV